MNQERTVTDMDDVPAAVIRAIVVAIHRAGGELRYTKAEYQAAVRSSGARPGGEGGILVDHPDGDEALRLATPDDLVAS